MEYTVQKLAELAGITGRTLRYYDEIGILKPARINSSGYRVYGKQEVDKLQQILFYRALGVNLERIKKIVTDPSFDGMKALREHRARLLDKREQLDKLIANVDQTIAVRERGVTMSDKEKFAGFKQKLIDDNERKYGKEIRANYGDDVINLSNKAFKGMSEEEYAEFEKLQIEVITSLTQAMATKDPSGELAQKTADLHRQWLTRAWGRYDKAAHAGLAHMYVNDSRFAEYYNQHQPGAAEFLRDAILIYTGEKA